jgi:large subunit ribosomal protein L3
MATKAIVGEKVGMTQVWDEQHRLVPVTVLRVVPARVVQVKTSDRDGYSAYNVGDSIGVDVLAAGDMIDVTAVSKGKGFAGGMKRHNFKGMGASHGNHKHHRAPGSIGACATPSRVFKGTKMAGRMGGEQVTTLNLQVVEADAERELLLVKGNVPGPRGGLVLIRDAVRGRK